MTDFNSYQRTGTVSFFASPALPAAAFTGVRTRRMMAFGSTSCSSRSSRWFFSPACSS